MPVNYSNLVPSSPQETLVRTVMTIVSFLLGSVVTLISLRQQIVRIKSMSYKTSFPGSES